MFKVSGLMMDWIGDVVGERKSVRHEIRIEICNDLIAMQAYNHFNFKFARFENTPGTAVWHPGDNI